MLDFVVFLLILFVIAAVLRVDFYFTIVYFFFLIYLLARLWLLRSLRCLHIERRFVTHAFHGDQATVELTLQNTGILPIPWLEVHESLPAQLAPPPFYQEVVSVGSRERRQFRYTLNCRQRGYYPVGPLKVQSGDLLGVVRPALRLMEPEYIVVYPRVVALQQLGLPTSSPLVALPAVSPLFEDPARIMGVRDYQRGDSPRRIHWTATACAGRLLVKQYQPAIARDTLICLSLNQEDYASHYRYTATELAIVVAASIANHIAVREALPVGLATEAWDPLLEAQTRFHLPPRKERGHLMSLLEVLARVQVVSDAPFVDLLRRQSVHLSWGGTLAVVTGRESEALFDTLVYLRRAGFAVALILVQPGRPSDELCKRADLLSVPVHRVWQERDLETWR
jgi:uncharacterized protein (DUF58 family)